MIDRLMIEFVQRADDLMLFTRYTCRRDHRDLVLFGKDSAKHEFHRRGDRRRVDLTDEDRLGGDDVELATAELLISQPAMKVDRVDELDAVGHQVNLQRLPNDVERADRGKQLNSDSRLAAAFQQWRDRALTE